MALHDQLLPKKMREAKHAFETRYRTLCRQYRRGLTKLIATGETLLDPDRPRETTLAALLQELDEPTLREAVTICAERQYLEDRGEIDALRARYPGLRRYPPAFLPHVPGRAGEEVRVILGLEVLRQLDTGTRKTLPTPAPTAFVPGKFRAALSQNDGTLDRRTWELGLAVSLRDSLRSGDVYLPESRRHVSFTNPVYDPTRWQDERDAAYTELQLPQEPDDFCTRLQREFDEAAGKWHTDCRATTLRPFATTVSIAKSVRPWNCHPGSFTCAAPSRGRCLVSASKTS